MAEESVDEIRVAGTLKVYSAPEDADLPDPADFPDASTYDADNGLSADYELVGFTSPDGSQFSDSKTTAGIMVHQRFRKARTIVTEVASSAQFVMRQWNPTSVTLGFGGGTITEPSAGVYVYEPPAPEDLQHRIIVMDSIDGDIIQRFIIKRGMVSGDTTVNFARTDASDIPITIEADETSSTSTAWVMHTNDPAMAPTGS